MPPGTPKTLSFRGVGRWWAVPLALGLAFAPDVHADDGVFRPTPEEAVAFALSAHPAIREQRDVVAERDALITEAWSAVWPAIDGRASVVRNRDPGLLNSPNFNQFEDLGFDPAFLQPIPVTTYDYRIAVDQLLYAFGKVARGVEAARFAREADDLRLRSVRSTVARDVLVAYYDLAGARARMDVVAAERAALEREVRRAQDFLDVGAGTRLGALQAEAALAALRPRELEARGEIRSGRARLNEALGRDPSLPLEIDVQAVVDRGIPEVPDLDRLTGAVARRPELRALARDADVLARLGDIERAGTRPEFRLTGSAGIRTIETGRLGDDRFASWDVGFYLEWPLFDGRASRSRARGYDARRRATEARRESSGHAMIRGLVVAHEAYLESAESWTAAGVAVEVAEEARRVADEESRWGAATTLDVLEAERTLSSARLQRIEAAVGALAAEAEIRFQIGLLPGEPWPHAEGGDGR